MTSLQRIKEKSVYKLSIASIISLTIFFYFLLFPPYTLFEFGWVLFTWMNLNEWILSQYVYMQKKWGSTFG